MDGNYELHVLPFSLKTMCATKVVCEVLIACGIQSLKGSKLRRYDVLAMDRIATLGLPQSMKVFVESLVGPMHEQLENWYKNVSSCDTLIFTPHGTINKVLSAKSFVDNVNNSMRDRIIIGSEFCCEDSLYEIFTSMQLDKCDKNRVEHLKRMSPVARFWISTYLGEYKDRSAVEGFKIAYSRHYDVALKFFIGKLSFEEVRTSIPQVGFTFFFSDFTVWSPDTLCLLFSKIAMEDQRREMSNFCSCLFYSLLRWPYLGLAMEAVPSLVCHMSGSDYRKMLQVTINYIKCRRCDFDYCKLFVRLWRAGSRYMTSSHFPFVRDIMLMVLNSDDKPLISLMFSEMSTEFKDWLLFDFAHYSLWIKPLNKQNKYQALSWVIEGCAMNRRDVLLSLKTECITRYPKAVRRRFFYKDEFKTNQQCIKEIVLHLLNKWS